MRVLRAAYRASGNSASREIVTVAEVAGRPAAAMAAFPAAAIERRAHRFLRKTLARTPPWTWPGAIRVFPLGGEGSPPPPLDSFFVGAPPPRPPVPRPRGPPAPAPAGAG